MKIAVLGTGSAGQRHLRAIHSIPGVEPIAIPVRSCRLAQLAAEGYSTCLGIPEAAQAGVNALIIATNTARHGTDALLALGEKLDVLVEKPLAVDSVQGDRVCQQASNSARQVYVGCVLRFSQSLNSFRQLLPEIGATHSVRIECGSYLPSWRPERPYQQSYSADPEAGGVLLDLIHEIDYAGWLFGWPGALQARIKNLGRLGIAADELAELSWENATGCVVSVNLDYLSRVPTRQMRAAGERGTLIWDGMANTVTLAVPGAPDRVFTSQQTRDEMFVEQDQAFVQAVSDTLDSRLATAAAGVKALAVCDAARKASASRREEMVSYP
ncbi:MAG: Gfo/Idh/MocA family protein [Dehalococcoidia bacterium]